MAFDFTSHEDVAKSLQTLAQKHQMSVTPVSWEDCTRGWDKSGKLSCLGSNIADVRILDKKRQPVYTLRSENWNERLAIVSATDLALVVGNEEFTSEKKLKSITLKKYLESAGVYGDYAGVPFGTDLFKESLDQKISVRFQTVFLPQEPDLPTEFTSSVYSYNTQDASDPQNLLLFCTAQGTSLQQDRPGQEKLFLHMGNSDGSVSTYWLKAVESQFKVGQAQKETQESALRASEQKQAVARHIGTAHMGTRCNVVMMVQIPMKKKHVQPRLGFGFGGFSFGDSSPAIMDLKFGSSEGVSVGSMESMTFGGGMDGMNSTNFSMNCSSPPLYRGGFGAPPPPPKKNGLSMAARVSLGSLEQEKWSGLSTDNFQRHPEQHITATITMYYTVKGGVPAPEDIENAIKDINECFAACDMVARLDKLAPLGITAPKGAPVGQGGFSFAPPTLMETFPI